MGSLFQSKQVTKKVRIKFLQAQLFDYCELIQWTNQVIDTIEEEKYYYMDECVPSTVEMIE